MTTRIWSKPITQKFIVRLRAAGYQVEKLNGGYVCHQKVENGLDLVFKAMIGSRGYLVSLNEDYIK